MSGDGNNFTTEARRHGGKTKRVQVSSFRFRASRVDGRRFVNLNPKLLSSVFFVSPWWNRFRAAWLRRMVDLKIANGVLTLHVHGADQLWALKSSLEIPLQHIRNIRADPEVARGWSHGVRMPGNKCARRDHCGHLLPAWGANLLGRAQSG